MKSSIVVGYFGSYQAAYKSVGKRFKENGKYSIQPACGDYRMHPWVLIYYGNFV